MDGVPIPSDTESQSTVADFSFKRKEGPLDGLLLFPPGTPQSKTSGGTHSQSFRDDNSASEGGGIKPEEEEGLVSELWSTPWEMPGHIVQLLPNVQMEGSIEFHRDRRVKCETVVAETQKDLLLMMKNVDGDPKRSE